MSKIENICKAVANLPKTSADANVFMLDDFSGQIQGSWSDKKIVWSKMFKELKESKRLPEKSNLITDFWVFTEEWIKEVRLDKKLKMGTMAAAEKSEELVEPVETIEVTPPYEEDVRQRRSTRPRSKSVKSRSRRKAV